MFLLILSEYGILVSARLKDKQDKHDSAAQTGDIDPTEWTGNQRVLHYGPLAVRDKFFYYYPKGWDILYPASFGFFPYRTKFVNRPFVFQYT